MRHGTAITFAFAALTISANIMVMIALHHMKAAKKSVVIFLSNLAVCNLVQGTAFFMRGLFDIWPVLNGNGCRFITMATGAAVMTYICGILYVYLDLFWSLRKPRKPKTPTISTRIAICMIVATWILMTFISLLGFLFQGEDWIFINSVASCVYSSGIFHPGLIIAVCLIIFMTTVAIITCHIMIIKLIRASYSGTIQAQQEPASSVSAKWLNTQRSLVQMMLVVMAVFSVCWWPVIIIQLVAALCPTCTIPPAVVFMMQGLIIMTYISNGFIYLAKSRDFKRSCRKLLCGWRVAQVEPSVPNGEL